MACGLAAERWKGAGLPLAIATLWLWLTPVARAASLSAKDVQIIAKVLTFLDPPLNGGRVAIVYAGGSTTAKHDAEAILTLFGDGIKTRHGLIIATLVEVGMLSSSAGYSAVILAADTPGHSVATTSKALRIPCISADTALVRQGACTIAIRSEPKVDITVNHAAAEAAGIAFAPMFQMLIHEL